ncbi:Ca2+ regulator and membrane fusion protein Fig1-domain-containing protein [Lipomyces japonicus]|uniref:Ca2+ regulator and membrane fusion protein Fig1-domain-containing protein n=1 Tax=Lipomyces japonicus TaxID=56871 RepID=UPI0034CD4E45
MFCISVLPGKVKPSPARGLRGFVVLMLFISIFLILFSILGSSSAGQAYSSVYAVKFTSRLTATNATVEARSGYYGVCVFSSLSSSSITCSGLSNVTSLDQYRNVKATTTSGSSSVDLIDLAVTLSQHIIHPALSIASLTFVILAFCSTAVRMFIVHADSILAGASNTAALWSSVLSLLLLGMNASWTHAASTSLARILTISTSGTITATMGRKLDAMAWTTFSFLLIVSVSNVALAIQDDREAAKSQLEDAQKQQIQQQHGPFEKYQQQSPPLATTLGMKYEPSIDYTRNRI